MNTITRDDYMNKKVSHQEFYGQFVTDSVKRYVQGAIGRDKIVRSSDKHFNDIPLHQWDNLTYIKQIIDRDLLRMAMNHSDPSTYPWSMCTQVCIAKEAARQIRNSVVDKKE